MKYSSAVILLTGLVLTGCYTKTSHPPIFTEKAEPGQFKNVLVVTKNTKCSECHSEGEMHSYRLVPLDSIAADLPENNFYGEEGKYSEFYSQFRIEGPLEPLSFDERDLYPSYPVIVVPPATTVIVPVPVSPGPVYYPDPPPRPGTPVPSEPVKTVERKENSGDTKAPERSEQEKAKTRNDTGGRGGRGR